MLSCYRQSMKAEQSKTEALPDAGKVSASRIKGEASFLSENSIDEEILKKAINDTGYTFVSISSDEYKKRGLFGK